MITKLLYDPQTGKIYYSVKEQDWFRFTHTTNIPLEIFEIDEIDPDNKGLVVDIEATLNKTDSQGQNKYTIEADPSDGELSIAELEGWTEYVEDIS